MKLLISALLLLVAIVTIIEAIPYQYEKEHFEETRRCTSQADCPYDHCCMITPVRYAHPHCVRRPRSGDTCRPRPVEVRDRRVYDMNGIVRYMNEAYENICPCFQGLACDSRQLKCRNLRDIGRIDY